MSGAAGPVINARGNKNTNNEKNTMSLDKDLSLNIDKYGFNKSDNLIR